MERGWQGIEKIKADLQQPRKLVISYRTIQTQMRFSVLIGRKAVYASRKFHAPAIERETVAGYKCVEAILQIQITIVQPHERQQSRRQCVQKKQS